MPVISCFFGIYSRMFHDDHNPPHFHAEYQGQRALIRISDGEGIAGGLPKWARRIVKEWCLEHQMGVESNWKRAVAFEPLELIREADND